MKFAGSKFVKTLLACLLVGLPLQAQVPEVCTFRPANFYNGAGTKIASAFVRAQLVIGSATLMQTFSDPQLKQQMREQAQRQLTKAEALLTKKVVNVIEKEMRDRGVVMQNLGDAIISPNPAECSPAALAQMSENEQRVQCFGWPRIFGGLRGDTNGFEISGHFDFANPERSMAEILALTPSAFVMTNVRSRRLAIDLDRINVACQAGEQAECRTDLFINSFKMTWDLKIVDISKLAAQGIDFTALDKQQKLAAVTNLPVLARVENLNMEFKPNSDSERVKLNARTCMIEMKQQAPGALEFKSFLQKLRDMGADFIGGSGQMITDLFIPKATLLNPEGAKLEIPQRAIAIGYDPAVCGSSKTEAARESCEISKHHKHSPELYYLNSMLFEMFNFAVAEFPEVQDEMESQINSIALPSAIRIANGPLMNNIVPVGVIAEDSVPQPIKVITTKANEWFSAIYDGARRLLTRDSEKK